MDEYIKRNELAEMIEKNVNLPYGEGYTGKDHELVDWCKGECIRMAHCLPFVCDVVPKSEDDWNSIPVDVSEALKQRAVEKAKSEVAREIFEEIDKRFEALLKFYPCNGEFEDAKSFVDFHWKHIRHSIMCDYDAELKKKYTEEKV